jgi:hypothetical protein
VELLASGKSADAPAPSPEDVFGIDPQRRGDEPAVAVREIARLPPGPRGRERRWCFLVARQRQTWMLMDEKRALILGPGDSVKIVRAALVRSASSRPTIGPVRRVR